VATGAYFSVAATKASNDVSGLFQSSGRWDDHWRSVEASGRNATVTSAVLYSVGGALTVTGVTLVLASRRGHRPQPEVAATP
jgi:hypothetical protein